MGTWGPRGRDVQSSKRIGSFRFLLSFGEVQPRSPEVEPPQRRPTKVEATCPESTWPVACESAPRNGALQEDKVRSVGNDMQGSWNEAIYVEH